MRKICSSSKTSVQRVVERHGAGQVGAERLLHDDPRPFDELGVGQQLDHGLVGRRRDAQVVQPAGVAADLGLLFGHVVGEGRRARPWSGTKVRRRSKLAHCSSEILSGGVAVAGVAGQVAEVLVAELARGRCPMMRYSGIIPEWPRWSSPGSSLRAARSPVAPKRTMTWGSSCLAVVRRQRDRLGLVDDLAHRAGLPLVELRHVAAHDLGHRLGRRASAARSPSRWARAGPRRGASPSRR